MENPDPTTMVSFDQQYYVERQRNLKFEMLAMMVSMLLPVVHGFLFLWIPWILRHYRDKTGLRYQKYFTFIKYFDTFTRVFKVTIFGRPFYLQPSLLVVMAFHLGVNGILCFVQTKDIDYELRFYIISKRIGRIAIGNLPAILVLVAKNDVISSLSGLSLDKAVFFHKWLGRFMFIAVTIHMYLSLKYWLDMKFYIMVQIPPQIFGMISYSCLGMLNLASLKIFRNFAFDLFLAQHRVFNFVMLLLAFFHNHGNRAGVILGVHLLVLDRITSRVIGIIHKRKSPTKGISEFEVLDDTTIRISIPIKISDANPDKWWWCFVPRYGTWRAGQHVHLSVRKVAFFQYHPFTIASLPDSRNIVILLKVQKGFTRKLRRKLAKLAEKQNLDDEESVTEVKTTTSQLTGMDTSRCTESETSNSRIFNMEEEQYRISTRSVQEFKDVLDLFRAPEMLQLSAQINGPYGGHYQPLTKFDNIIFFSAGSGASFTLPVALDTLKTIRKREDVGDFLYRPQRTGMTIIMAIKKLENLQWYDHLWEEFLPFLDDGRVHLFVHVTQESSPVVSVVDDLDQKSEGSSREKNDKGESRFKISKTQSDSVSTTITASSFEHSGYSVTYGRPDFASIIGQAARQVSCMEYRKALAVLGCGPGPFNGSIKSECEKNKWIEGAPDVYTYTESFG